MNPPPAAIRIRATLVLALAAATTACGDRPGPERVSADVSGPPTARVEACARPGEGDAACTVWRVRPGDTLASIALKCYGDERLWTEIVRANQGVIRTSGGPPIVAGMTLVVPDVVR